MKNQKTQKLYEKKILIGTSDTSNATDLIFHFNFIDAVQIQQMFALINSGYEIKRLYSRNGVSEFVLSKKD